MKRAVSKPNLVLGSIIIIILASVVVIADTITTDDQASLANSTPGNVSLGNQSADAVVLQTGNLTTVIQPLKSAAGPDRVGYVVNGQSTINTSGYNCSVQNDGKVYLVCDSIYDGNGDGKCTSGESCIEFGIVGNYITRQERNSQDQWVDHDDSFTIVRAAVAS